jgi:uncharacterized membrane protein
MKQKPRIFSFLLMAILIFTWCPLISAADKEDRKAFEKRSEKELQSMDKKIEGLKSRISRAQTEAGKDYDAMLADLKEKREYAGKKWQELKESGSEKWDQAKSDFNSALKDLKESYNTVASRIERKDSK